MQEIQVLLSGIFWNFFPPDTIPLRLADSTDSEPTGPEGCARARGETAGGGAEHVAPLACPHGAPVPLGDGPPRTRPATLLCAGRTSWTCPAGRPRRSDRSFPATPGEPWFPMFFFLSKQFCDVPWMLSSPCAPSNSWELPPSHGQPETAPLLMEATAAGSCAPVTCDKAPYSSTSCSPDHLLHVWLNSIRILILISWHPPVVPSNPHNVPQSAWFKHQGPCYLVTEFTPTDLGCQNHQNK